MKTRIIHTRFWQDSYVINLNHKEKLAFIYLLTNDRVSMTGMYELPDRYIQVDLNLTPVEFNQIKEKFQKDGKIIFMDGWIRIVNHDKYNSYKGEKIEVAKLKELETVPEKLQKCSINTSIDTSMYTPNNHKSKIINQNIGVVKGKKKECSLEDITPEILQEIAEKYNVNIGFVNLQFEKMKNWLKSSGKVKKDYIATLRNFVLSGMEKHIERRQDDKYKPVDARGVR